MKDDVTFVITSSGRNDLLDHTIHSFLNLNKYPIERYILNEDSGDLLNGIHVVAKYGRIFDLLIHPKKEGLSKALDNLLKHVETQYVFTSENDWSYHNNKNFIAESIIILENNPSIHQVWIRDNEDHQHPLGKPYKLNGIEVRDVLKGYQTHWGGFTFNPSVRRMSDYKKYFPNGFAEFGDESICSKHVEFIGYKAVSLVNYACKHIGYGRRTEDFKI